MFEVLMPTGKVFSFQTQGEANAHIANYGGVLQAPQAGDAAEVKEIEDAQVRSKKRRMERGTSVLPDLAFDTNGEITGTVIRHNGKTVQSAISANTKSEYEFIFVSCKGADGNDYRVRLLMPDTDPTKLVSGSIVTLTKGQPSNGRGGGYLFEYKA